MNFKRWTRKWNSRPSVRVFGRRRILKLCDGPYAGQRISWRDGKSLNTLTFSANGSEYGFYSCKGYYGVTMQWNPV